MSQKEHWSLVGAFYGKPKAHDCPNVPEQKDQEEASVAYSQSCDIRDLCTGEAESSAAGRLHNDPLDNNGTNHRDNRWGSAGLSAI